MKRIDDRNVELTEPERILNEWHESLLNVGYGQHEAVEKMLNVTSTESLTWQLLNQQEFRDWLTSDTGTVVALQGELPIALVLSQGEVEMITDARNPTPEICGAEYRTGGSDPYSSECDLKPNHEQDYHEAEDPMDAANMRVRWRGGGSCAGDPLPIRDVQFVPKR